MSQNILTNALSTYKAQCEAENKPLVLDKFVFAYVPGQDPNTPIDPDETLPPNEQIQGIFDVSQKGFINPDAVVYSIILGTDIGTWPFNWIGLINSETNLVGAIIHTVDQTKESSEPLSGIEGDTLTRNIITTYTNATDLTQIVVSADVWQLDFNNRLMAMDDRVRQNNLANYGDAAFIKNGWRVVNIAGETIATVTPGISYVGGLNCTNPTTQVLDISKEVLPKTVYLVSSFQGTVNSKWETQSELRITDTLAATWVENGVTYYSSPLSSLTSTADAEDLRYIYKPITFYDTATLEKKGIVQLSNAINSDDETTAATPKAIRDVKKIADEKWSAQDATLEQKGIVQLSNAIDSDDETTAATPKAIRDVKKIADEKWPAQDATLEQKGIVQLETMISDDETKAATPRAVNIVLEKTEGKLNQIDDQFVFGMPARRDKDISYGKEVTFTSEDWLIPATAAGTFLGGTATFIRVGTYKCLGASRQTLGDPDRVCLWQRVF